MTADERAAIFRIKTLQEKRLQHSFRQNDAVNVVKTLGALEILDLLFDFTKSKCVGFHKPTIERNTRPPRAGANNTRVKTEYALRGENERGRN